MAHVADAADGQGQEGEDEDQQDGDADAADDGARQSQAPALVLGQGLGAVQPQDALVCYVLFY